MKTKTNQNKKPLKVCVLGHGRCCESCPSQDLWVTERWPSLFTVLMRFIIVPQQPWEELVPKHCLLLPSVLGWNVSHCRYKSGFRQFMGCELMPSNYMARCQSLLNSYQIFKKKVSGLGCPLYTTNTYYCFLSNREWISGLDVLVGQGTKFHCISIVCIFAIIPTGRACNTSTSFHGSL